MLSTLALIVLAASARPAPPTGQCAAVVVSSAQAPRGRTTFSARQILDVEFTASLRKKLTGNHVLSLKVYTPKGHLYQELSVPFYAGSPDGGTAKRASARLPKLATRMPVGGTSITNASLYGKWKVVPHIDGNVRSCSAATTFSIKP
jgi:hypothetical protein